MAMERWSPFATSLERWEPFREIESEMNRLFDGFLSRPTAIATGAGTRVWMPVLDMYETKDDLILNFELPGVRVKATYRDGVLEVRLPKADEVKPKEIKIDIL